MNEHKRKVEALFEAAKEITSSEQRAAYLDRHCGGDTALREEIVGLLRAAEQAGGFLGAETGDEAAATARVESPPLHQPGDRIGRYKLLERLGEGGCGVVYMAEQTEPIRRRVALKVIKLGMDTKQVIARFEAERQALALMDHPNIAKVLDAGATDNGRPYFVMELVRGIRATDYCNQNKLSTRQRIELFIQVCQAVQHAHQKGVIHRDLKPSNILVSSADGVPVPKVIDFGIAKATNQQPLTDKTLFTAFAQFIGTPAYMSPEQAELSALDIDTRSDIYSLGVLLYELLTGQPPFAPETLLNAGLDEMRRIIRETEPPRPSTRIQTELTRNPQSAVLHSDLKEVRGDLDWIVMKCLEKDRARRYGTASGLAADLKRHLENEPIEARPPSTVYRLQKTFRRHKLAFAAGSAVAASLVLGVAIASWQAILATRARSAAQAAQIEENRERLRADAKAAEAQAREAEATRERDRADANARRFGRDLYVADLRLAQQAWEDARIPRVQELLHGQRPERTAGADLRGFEWYHWQRRVHARLYNVRDGTACGLAFSPDGTRLATAGHNRKLKIRDADTGKELLSLDGHKGGTVWAVAFSPDGTRLASATGNFGSANDIGEIKIWDSRTGAELLHLDGHAGSITSLAFSPDGKHLASSSGDRTVRLWDTTTGRESLNLAVGPAAANCVAISPDGARLAAASDSDSRRPGELKVWDVRTGQPVFSRKGPWRVFSVTFSPDGKLIVSGSSEGLRVWNAADGEEVPLFRDSGAAPARSVVFSSNGKLLAAGYGRIVKIWDTATGLEAGSFRGPFSSVLSVALSPDGRRLVAGDGWNLTAWDAASNPEGLTFRSVNSLAVAYSPDGKRLATAGWNGAAQIRDAATGQPITDLQMSQSGNRPTIRSLAFSLDGRRLAGGGEDKLARIFDAATGREILRLPEHAAAVNGVAFSPDGTRLATASGANEQGPPGEVIVWDTATGQELLRLGVPSRDRERPSFTSVSFSPDGKLLAAGVTQYVGTNGQYVAGETRLWDAATGELKFALADTHHVTSVAFSPDGRRLSSACLVGTLKIWDTLSGQEICSLKGYTANVNGVVFSPDGNRLASAGDDAAVTLWDTATCQEVLTLRGHSDRVYSVAFSPDGRRLASASQDGTIKIWEAATPEQVAAWQKEDQVAAR